MAIYWVDSVSSCTCIIILFELENDKTYKIMWPSKASDQPAYRRSLSESSLYTYKSFGSLGTQRVPSKSSDQTGSLILIFASFTSQFVGFVLLLHICHSILFTF